MTGQFAALTLPALSALPAGGGALLELQTGAARSSIFRVGWRPYTWGKLLSCLVSGLLAQMLSFLMLLGLLQGMRLHAMGEGFPLHMLATSLSAAAARALCGSIWAAVGSILALLTESASAATIGPLCLFYAPLMVGTRFFPEQPAVNPATWQKRDEEMASCKKGNDWHFGMKAHVGIDAGSGLIHSLVTTFAKVPDVTQGPC